MDWVYAGDEIKRVGRSPGYYLRRWQIRATLATNGLDRLFSACLQDGELKMQRDNYLLTQVEDPTSNSVLIQSGLETIAVE